MEQDTELEDREVLSHPVVGVGEIHGGDAQEVNKGCIVAASTQRAQAAGRKIRAGGRWANPPAHPGSCRGPRLTWGPGRTLGYYG